MKEIIRIVALLSLSGMILTGCSSGGSNEKDIMAAPAGVKAEAQGADSILLSWSPVAGAVRYDVYTGSYFLKSVETTTYVYSGLTPSTRYCCTVRAINAVDRESPESEQACATTFGDSASPSPGHLVILDASHSKISLSWNPVTGATEYRVYRDGVLIGQSSSPSMVDSGLLDSTSYCYAVSAVVDGVESPLCPEVCGTTLPPPLDATLPTVIATSPAQGATNVQIDPLTISAIYSEAMNTLSAINTANFTVSGLTGVVPGVRSYDAATHTVTFTPSAALASGSTYTVRISSNVRDVAGNMMGTDFIWSFITAATSDITLPTVISTNPSNGELNVPIDAVITAVFSEPVNSTAIDLNNFSCDGGVIGLISYDDPTDSATLRPSAHFNNGTTYTCRIRNVQDQSGHAMAAEYTWTFSTVP